MVLHTLGDLFPGVRATDARDPAAVVKGDERMVRVLQQAVRDRQAAPRRDLIVNAEGVDVLWRGRRSCAPRPARSTRKPHNVARKLFVTDLLTDLARAEARVLNRPLDDEACPTRAPGCGRPRGLTRRLTCCGRCSPRKCCWSACWGRRMRSGPPRGAGLGSPRTGAACPYRNPSRWTVADVPLLDEAAELLGVDDSRSGRRAARPSAPAAPSRSTRRRYSTRRSFRAWSSP